MSGTFFLNVKSRLAAAKGEENGGAVFFAVKLSDCKNTIPSKNVHATIFERCFSIINGILFFICIDEPLR